MITLESALNACKTHEDLFRIFRNDVTLKIDANWGTDRIKIQGYIDYISTDFLAERILDIFWQYAPRCQGDQRDELANTVEDKVFIPLKCRLRSLDRSGRCMSPAFLYKIRNAARAFYTPSDTRLTGGYAVLKHSMCTMAIRDRYF